MAGIWTPGLTRVDGQRFGHAGWKAVCQGLEAWREELANTLDALFHLFFSGLLGGQECFVCSMC
jgi:hypothetical protein